MEMTSENSLQKAAETAHKANDDNTAVPLAPTAAASGSLGDAGTQSPAVPNPQKKTVSGFAKAWIIFWIVGNLAATCAPANRLSDSDLGGLVAMVMLLSAAVAAGYILLLYKKPVGLYLILIANFLGILMNNIQVANYSINVTTGFVIGIITFFITRTQVAYPLGSPRAANQ
jgi:hypothetical protein